MNNFKLFIETNKDKLNAFAKDYVEKLEMPDILKESITYSLVNDGKKIRPLSFLYLLKYYGTDYSKYFDIALAIELVHTYSLVHDDLPEMDNDDYRWGKHTNHKVFGQDVAVLTGDAMLTLAFEVLSDADVTPELKVRLIKQFANYSGAMGMIAGQIYDVKQKDYDDVKEFGQQLGIAYQIKDDILDYYGDFEKIGKLPSDEDMITYLSFYGIEECEELLKQHTFNAITVAKRLNNNLLEDFANYLLKRDK